MFAFLYLLDSSVSSVNRSPPTFFGPSFYLKFKRMFIIWLVVRIAWEYGYMSIFDKIPYRKEALDVLDNMKKTKGFLKYTLQPIVFGTG